MDVVSVWVVRLSYSLWNVCQIIISKASNIYRSLFGETFSIASFGKVPIRSARRCRQADMGHFHYFATVHSKLLDEICKSHLPGTDTHVLYFFTQENSLLTDCPTANPPSPVPRSRFFTAVLKRVEAWIRRSRRNGESSALRLDPKP